MGTYIGKKNTQTAIDKVVESSGCYTHCETDFKAFDEYYNHKYEEGVVVLNPRQFAKEAFLAGVKYDDLEPRMPS